MLLHRGTGKVWRGVRGFSSRCASATRRVTNVTSVLSLPQWLGLYGASMDKPDLEGADVERAVLLAQVEALNAEIRRRTQELLARADTPAFFKNHPVVKEVVKWSAHGNQSQIK